MKPTPRPATPLTHIALITLLAILTCPALSQPPSPAKSTQPNQSTQSTQFTQFTALDTRGRQLDSRQWRGRLVVLEWWNPDCPPDQAYYEPPYMQKLQTEYTQRGVIWLLIGSASPGKFGHRTAAQANQWAHNRAARPSHIILDPTQKLARQFGAHATPHVYLLDPQGSLIYDGAPDDGGQKEYLREALEEALAGKPITLPKTRTFGCGIL